MGGFKLGSLGEISKNLMANVKPRHDQPGHSGKPLLTPRRGELTTPPRGQIAGATRIHKAPGLRAKEAAS